MTIVIFRPAAEEALDPFGLEAEIDIVKRFLAKRREKETKKPKKKAKTIKKVEEKKVEPTVEVLPPTFQEDYEKEALSKKLGKLLSLKELLLQYRNDIEAKKFADRIRKLALKELAVRIELERIAKDQEENEELMILFALL